MDVKLFFEDDRRVFGMERLRDRARREVRNSRLIQACGLGDLDAVHALHRGFWPFVNEFEKIIDRRKLPIGQLRKSFDRKKVGEVIAGLTEAVAEMQREEESHASHWAKDAECFGITNLHDDGVVVPEVRALIDSALDPDFSTYFAVLAGTEFIAEELSGYLVHCPAFTMKSTRRRWMWGEVHLIPHDHGPSHLEIDLDLARALESTSDINKIEAAVVRTITQFGKASNDVCTRLYDVRSVAPVV